MQGTVTIIGAGLSGLVLACSLHRHGVDVAVYEGEASPTVRSQGGLLDLHDDGGQRALREIGLHHAFRQRVRTGEDAKRIVDRHGTVLFEQAARGARPEIGRGDLRRILLDALPPDLVRWGRKVVSVTELTRGRHGVAFACGAMVETGLLVGADGAWSRVRPLLTDAVPAYTGTSFLELHLAADDRRAIPAARVIGAGTLMAVAPGQGILAHRNADGSIQTYVALHRPESWLPADATIAIPIVRALFDDWAPALSALIADSGDRAVVRTISALPASLAWPSKPGVTLMGDAAHLMSPFAGEGANLAMLDGVELARALLTAPDDRDGAMAAYEAALFHRSQPIARLSAENLERFFDSDAPAGVVKMFARE